MQPLNHATSDAAKTADRFAAHTRDLKKNRRRRRLVGSGLLIFAFLLLLWFLPAIAAHSPLLGYVLRLAAANLNGSIAFASASLGWSFQPSRQAGACGGPRRRRSNGFVPARRSR